MLAIALILLIAADAYFLVTTLADLFPLNNVRDAPWQERRLEALINGPVLLLPAVLLALAAVFGLRPLAYAAGTLELIASLGGVLLWWLPYLVGIEVPWATAGTGLRWTELHARTYARTIIVLPPIGTRPRPNLEHMLLHALMLAGAAAAILAAGSL